MVTNCSSTIIFPHSSYLKFWLRRKSMHRGQLDWTGLWSHRFYPTPRWKRKFVSSNGAVVCVQWFDNKCVTLASNYVGIGKPDKAHRYDKASKQKIKIDRPQIVKDYNLNMGEVDLMNQMISYYRIFIRSKKWTLRMITHFIDFAIINSWIEYKRDCQKAKVPIRHNNGFIGIQNAACRTINLFPNDFQADGSNYSWWCPIKAGTQWKEWRSNR